MNPLRPRRAQRGQALVLALVLMFAGLLGLFFMFGTGQVSATKQRLNNAADAAAYSAALWRARVLNFHAYSNRAIVAQEVAVAQAVTLTSWAKYFERFTAHAGVLATAWPPAAPVLSAAASVASTARELTERTAADEIEARAAPELGYKSLLQRSQEALQLAADTFGLGAVANEVARANDPGFFAFALGDSGAFNRFTRRYASDDDRRRLQAVVNDSLDRFVKGPRRDDLRLLLLPSSCFGTTTNIDRWFRWWRKRGGTEMSPDLERWQAVDTGSIHDYRRRGWLFSSCRQREWLPVGWGAAEATDHAPLSTVLGNPGNTWDNAAATWLASAEMTGYGYPGFERYSGIERVRELDYAALADRRYPVTQVVVLARAGGEQARTANALNVGTGRLRLFERFAGNRIWAMSVGEVYFRRPPGAPERIEYASLYNPYWQVRLAEPTAAQRPQRWLMRTEAERQRGQALVETLVAALVLVPLALLVVLLGKFQSMQQATIAASRTLAFECTVRPGACANAATHAALAEEVRRRHFGRIDREILSNDVIADPAPTDERNPLWVDRRGRPLLERFADVEIALALPRFDAGRSTAIGRAASGAASLLDRFAGPARFGLSITGGLVDARVKVRVSPSEAGNEQLARLDSLPLSMQARTAVLFDAWNASGPYGSAAGRVEARVKEGSRIDPIREAEIAVGYQLTLWALELMDLAGLEPSASAFRPHHVDVDRVPPDRIAP